MKFPRFYRFRNIEITILWSLKILIYLLTWPVLGLMFLFVLVGGSILNIIDILNETIIKLKTEEVDAINALAGKSKYFSKVQH